MISRDRRKERVLERLGYRYDTATIVDLQDYFPGTGTYTEPVIELIDEDGFIPCPVCVSSFNSLEELIEHTNQSHPIS